MSKAFLLMGSTFCLLSVVLGAFAAHGLKKHVGEYAVNIFKTGAEYQMMHGLALIALAFAIKAGIQAHAAGWFFTAGIVLFSGSLYLLAITSWKWLGPITPLGGLCFIIGWGILIFKTAKSTF